MKQQSEKLQELISTIREFTYNSKDIVEGCVLRRKKSNADKIIHQISNGNLREYEPYYYSKIIHIFRDKSIMLQSLGKDRGVYSIPFEKLGDFETVGRDINLLDVMQWVYGLDLDYRFSLIGCFYKKDDGKSTCDVINWDLNKPLLQDQSTNTINDLYNILLRYEKND